MTPFAHQYEQELFAAGHALCHDEPVTSEQMIRNALIDAYRALAFRMLMEAMVEAQHMTQEGTLQ